MWNLPDNAVGDLEPTTPTALGRLSRQIETNLKASADFYVGPKAEILSNVCRKENVVPTSSEPHAVAATTAPNPCSRKTSLDKYFRAVKTSRRPLGLSAIRLTAANKNDSAEGSVDVGKRCLDGLQIEDKYSVRPSPKVQLGTSVNGGNKLLFARNLSDRKCKIPNFSAV